MKLFKVNGAPDCLLAIAAPIPTVRSIIISHTTCQLQGLHTNYNLSAFQLFFWWRKIDVTVVHKRINKTLKEKVDQDRVKPTPNSTKWLITCRKDSLGHALPSNYGNLPTVATRSAGVRVTWTASPSSTTNHFGKSIIAVQAHQKRRQFWKSHVEAERIAIVRSVYNLNIAETMQKDDALDTLIKLLKVQSIEHIPICHDVLLGFGKMARSGGARLLATAAIPATPK